jgi:hypothetical protein
MRVFGDITVDSKLVRDVSNTSLFGALFQIMFSFILGLAKVSVSDVIYYAKVRDENYFVVFNAPKARKIFFFKNIIS